MFFELLPPQYFSKRLPRFSPEAFLGKMSMSLFEKKRMGESLHVFCTDFLPF
jgi:hypothetical protein